MRQAVTFEEGVALAQFDIAFGYQLLVGCAVNTVGDQERGQCFFRLFDMRQEAPAAACAEYSGGSCGASATSGGR